MIVAEEAGGVDDGELGAVLCALAGPRRGDAVAAVQAPARALRALLAATGTQQVERDARVVLAGEGLEQAREAASRVAPGGRVVALAPDAAAAEQRAQACGLLLRHVEPLEGLVAWSAVAALRP